MNKFSTALIASSALLVSANTMASEVSFSDPEEGGIGYEWTVMLGAHDMAEITGSVGGKSSFEPNFEAPQIGWTHTSDWVAVDLQEESVLEIVVSRQQGIYELSVDREDPSIRTFKTSGGSLYPALSVYKGWDSTTEQEQGSFNPIGNFWSTIEYQGAEYSKLGEKSITYRTSLPAGQYSINIGGVNAIYCAETDECFNGVHGYRAKFTTSHVHMMHMPGSSDTSEN